MKKITFLFLFFLAAQVTFSQVVVVNHMKVPPGGGSAYEKAEQHAQKVMQERVNRGEMVGWELFRVLNRGAGSDYHYVTVDIYANLVSSLKGISDEAVEAALGDKADAAIDEIMASRELVFRTTLEFADGFFSEVDEKYLYISFMKAYDPSKYFEMEQTSYKPLHKLAIDNGEMAGWTVWVPRIFDEENTNYTALTVNAYTTLEQMGSTNYGKWYEEYISDKTDEEIATMDKLFEDTGKIRKVIQAQVWEKIASTTPADN